MVKDKVFYIFNIEISNTTAWADDSSNRTLWWWFVLRCERKILLVNYGLQPYLFKIADIKQWQHVLFPSFSRF